ncbi:response regulator [Bermanella marisrubri]|uniref:Sensory/regulatory protein RpfC n=1 Tax=Bermanella marisrubri TaxID=207949 RepID=Q1N2R9_9GAMM|nr:response regulator [Bermanella marisrubri]EAT12600.1 Signal transduction histidine kinase [Oceanobacter sp. RED65] [Bermanella marisrubri]QIZ84847.1 response regulator [Bermanella marisrubri]
MSLNQLQHIIRRTLWSYISAIVLIAFISTLSYWTTQSAIQEQEADSQLINMAGRQRMLSQRIALYAQKHFTLTNSEAAVKANAEVLRVSAHLMLENHQALIKLTQNENIKSMYFGGEKPSLNELVIRFTDEAKYLSGLSRDQFPISENLSILSTDHSDQLLERLDGVVTAYEYNAEQKVTVLKNLQLSLWFLMLAALVLIGMFILKPSLQLIKNSLLQEKQKQHRIQLAADSAKLGIWEYQLSNGKLTWDKTMWRIFNAGKPANADEALATFKARLHPLDKSRVMDLFYQAVNQQTPFHTQFRIQTDDSEIKTIKADAIIEYDVDGNATAIVGTNQDISAQQQQEQALIDARMAAEHAARVKGDFLASMSHEIRTPMNGIMGMLELLKNTELTTLQAQRVNIALSSSKSLLVLINDILDFSKIEADRLILEEIDFNLRSLLGELTEALSQLAESKNIELVLDTVEVHQDMVKGDPSRIRQIITNLISNAIKFTHQGEVLIRVSLQEYSLDQWQVNFSVKDSGIGITQGQQKKLFDAFSQADSSTTREYGGTGLGLAIVKKLCEAMDGQIRVKSKMNIGSEFYGHLFVKKSERSRIIAPNYDISQLSILVVDDNKINREVLSQQLTTWGASVVQADSAEMAWKVMDSHFTEKKQAFDVALLDMQMPHTSGTELGQKIQADPRYKGVRLVLMTSMLLNSDHKAIAKMGFCGYFSKPVTTDDLFMILNVIGDDGEALQQASPLLTHDYLSSLQKEPATSDAEVRLGLASAKHKHVLLVEDNPINQLVAQDTLEELGLIVDIAQNGQEAISRLQEHRSKGYSLIFMDCQMPVMDGYEASRAIRNGEAGDEHRKTPIIALTANAMKEDRDHCIEAGMDDFISKPMDIEVLKTTIKTWLIDR